jgi:ABC-type multidrug transport system fused ATPase/permease subunit
MNNAKRLFGYLQPYRLLVALIAVLLLFTTAGDLVIPRILGWTIDVGLASRDMGLVIRYCLILLGVAGLKSLFAYVQGICHALVGENVVRDLRDQLYARLQRLSFSYFTTMPTGDIMSRLTSDLEAVEEFVSWGFVLFLMVILNFVTTFVMLLVLDWHLTLAIVAPVPFLGLVVFLFNRRVGPAWDAIREQMGKLTSVLQEAVSGVRVVKAFAREPHEVTKFGAQNWLNLRRNLERGDIEAYSFPLMDFLMNLSFVVLTWYGATRVMNGATSLGTFFSFTWYIWGIVWPVRMAGFLVSIMRQALAAAPRLFEILDAGRDIADAPEAIEMPRIRGHIRFEDVSFAFPDTPEQRVLEGFNLEVLPGQTVAILGGTGSGKSSVINLVPRFYDPVAGRVTVDGHDVRQVRPESLRRQVGIVPQETFLFSASVSENIAYGQPDAKPEEIVEVAKTAQAHEFVTELIEGYDTRVGERGVGLSGGQKQRIALARALLMDPRILILDEATSSVDTETEFEIQQALEAVMAHRTSPSAEFTLSEAEGLRTSIVIAQRLSTIKRADKIVVIKDGQVVEEGTHQELLARGGEYTRLYNLQYREQDLVEELVLA